MFELLSYRIRQLFVPCVLALLGAVGEASAEVGEPRRARSTRSVAAVPAGSISISNTVLRKNCGDGRTPAKCTWSGAPLAGKRVRPEALAALKKVFNFPPSEREAERFSLPDELVPLLVEVSATFRGAHICVISGFRKFYCGDKPCNPYQKKASNHLQGHALDITLIGVDNVDLATYVLELNETDPRFARRLGVGFYPNQEHVHVDVREKPRYWVDTSLGGEPPHYDPSKPSPAKAFLRHFDADRAPARPGSRCPTLEATGEDEADPDESGTSHPQRSPNVFFTDPPMRARESLGGSIAVERIDFTLLPELDGLENL